ncbi:MAG: CARDB domain-containing protein [Gudongella sp.]|nr:CARDB domain-containing protein [Gudongella sp.]
MKKYSIIFMVLVLIISGLPMTALATEPAIEVEPSYERPDLVVVSGNSVTTEAGDSFDLEIELKNTGDVTARDITATLSSDSSGMVYTDKDAYDEIKSISSGKKDEVNFDIEVADKAPNGSYSLELDIVYYNSSNEKYELSKTIYIRVLAKDSPDLIITRTDIMPSSQVNPGDQVIVGFEIENTGDGLAKDIRVSLPELSKETFYLTSGTSNKRIDEIRSGKKGYVYFELTAAASLSYGNYELEVDLNYKNDENVENDSKEYFSINILKSDPKAAKLIIKNIVYPTGTLYKNQQVKLTFEVENIGPTPALDIEINAKSQDESGLVSKTLGQAKYDALNPGETLSFQFLFITTEGGETKNYPIDITVDYTDEFVDPDLRDSLLRTIGIFLYNRDTSGDNISTPKLIIDRYDFSPSIVKAGENFQMNLSFFNTNQSKSVKNIKIFLTAEEETDSGSVFTPVNSSNTFYIDSIAPKGKVDKVITMYTIPDAKAKTYTLTANFEYEDSAANTYTAEELIGVPVVQQSKLDLGEIVYQPEAYIGQQTPISIEFYNTGKVTLYNLMVKLEGDFQSENGQYFVGNFNSGANDFYEGYVIPQESGQLEGNLVFTFEDSTGQEQEIKEPFSLNVVEMPPMEFPDGEIPDMEEPSLMSKVMKFLIPGLILIAVIIGVILFRKKRAKKHEKDLEIDE